MFNIGYLCGLQVSEISKLHQEYFNKPVGELFYTRKGNLISSRQLYRLMKHYAGKVKLPKDKAHWHTLKHAIAVHLPEATRMSKICKIIRPQ